MPVRRPIQYQSYALALILPVRFVRLVSAFSAHFDDRRVRDNPSRILVEIGWLGTGYLNRRRIGDNLLCSEESFGFGVGNVMFNGHGPSPSTAGLMQIRPGQRCCAAGPLL
jgi:hypothetical protein